jgi:hypothetical protein
VSKKDRQQPLTPQLANQPSPALQDGERQAIAVQEEIQARIQHLEEELTAERSRHATEYNALSEKAVKLRMDLLAIQVLVEGPENHITIETEDGKAALTAVSGVLAQRKALHSDLMVLEQTAAGRAPDIALQTDLGKSAAHALSEVLTMLDTMNEQRLDGPALPLNGWASDTARHLVEAVPPHERVLLLGDLLAQLLPHTGEQGQNETASDVLKRIIGHLDNAERVIADYADKWQRALEERNALAERMVTIQSAMVARRAPDAEAGGVLEQVMGALAVTMRHDDARTGIGGIVALVERIVREWQGLRAFFSEAPLTAVAVRDDGHKGPVRERYSLLVLTWDGKAVKTRLVEGTRPWGDIRPYLDQTVRQSLIPGAYR